MDMIIVLAVWLVKLTLMVVIPLVLIIVGIRVIQMLGDWIELIIKAVSDKGE